MVTDYEKYEPLARLAQEFAETGIASPDGREIHNVGLTEQASWHITVIPDTEWGPVAYITKEAGVRITFAIPPLIRDHRFYRDPGALSGIRPKYFPDIRELPNPVSYVHDAVAPSDEQLDELSGVIRELISRTQNLELE